MSDAAEAQVLERAVAEERLKHCERSCWLVRRHLVAGTFDGHEDHTGTRILMNAGTAVRG